MLNLDLKNGVNLLKTWPSTSSQSQAFLPFLTFHDSFTKKSPKWKKSIQYVVGTMGVGGWLFAPKTLDFESLFSQTKDILSNVRKIWARTWQQCYSTCNCSSKCWFWWKQICYVAGSCSCAGLPVYTVNIYSVICWFWWIYVNNLLYVSGSCSCAGLPVPGNIYSVIMLYVGSDEYK